jgi:hypothetical protein
MCAEWSRRGFADTVADTLGGHVRDRLGLEKVRTQAQLRRSRDLPRWLGDEGFHRAHQSNLLRKDRDHYGPLFEDVPDDLEYVWPPPDDGG